MSTLLAWKVGVVALGIVVSVNVLVFWTVPALMPVSIQVRTFTEPVPSAVCGTVMVVSRIVFVVDFGSV
jgi:hypothetical protein